MQEQNENLDEYFITPNVIESGLFFGIPHRHWFEAVFFTLLVILIINAIPFTSIVKGVLCVTFGVTVFRFHLQGLCNRSVTEMIAAEYRFMKHRRVLHLRGPEYVKKKQDFSQYAGGDETNLERIIRQFKGRLNDLADSILEDSDGEEDKEMG